MPDESTVPKTLEAWAPALPDTTGEFGEGWHRVGTEVCDKPAPHAGPLTSKITELMSSVHDLIGELNAPFRYSYEAVHERLHEIYTSLIQAAPDSATWTGAWFLTKSEFEQLAGDVIRREKSRAWEIEDGKFILWKPNGISLKILRGKEDLIIPVITGFLKPVRSVVVEGWTYFEVFISPTEKVVASNEELFKRLRRDGRIRKKRLGEDVLVEVLWELASQSGTAFPTFGLYQREVREFELVTEPVPVQEHQRTAADKVGNALLYEATKEDLEVFFHFEDHFKPFELYPAMGLTAISPAAYLLRSLGIFVPHAFHWSRAHGLGKSSLASDLSLGVWGREWATGDGLNSEFRLAAELDACCTSVIVDEAEQIDFRRLGAMIKTSCERPIVTRRGTTLLTTVPYASRSVLFLTGNNLPPRSGALLTRFLAPRFDSGLAVERRARKAEYDKLRQQVRPVGKLLATSLKDEFPTAQELLPCIRDLELQISKTAGPVFQDIRRPQMWAVVYAGLQVWARAAKARGLDWKPPSISEFVSKVALPVDYMTFEGKETIVDSFRSWFALWKNRNVSKVTEYHDGGRRGERTEFREDVRGRGTLFEEEELVVGKRIVRGVWVTKPLVDEYNKQAAPDLQIGSLRELATVAADDYSIPHELVLDSKDGKPLHRPTGKRARAAFVPDEEGPAA
jgi:hypothetical protein